MWHKRTRRAHHRPLAHLSESTLVDQLADSLEVGVTVGHVRFHQTQHLDGGGVQLHEHRVVDLAEAEELQDLAHLGGDSDDTADADNEHHTGLRTSDNKQSKEVRCRFERRLKTQHIVLRNKKNSQGGEVSTRKEGSRRKILYSGVCMYEHRSVKARYTRKTMG